MFSTKKLDEKWIDNYQKAYSYLSLSRAPPTARRLIGSVMRPIYTACRSQSMLVGLRADSLYRNVHRTVLIFH